ncbi:hypothetical protein [Micromonospora craniellae]|nr:hypothetical protein [Micromonospora craniellae]QOC91961.1 hypothetical protein ID554_29455 [Micromonospora craniellae]
MIAVIGVDFTVPGPPELLTALREPGERCHRGVSGDDGGGGGNPQGPVSD